MEFDGHSLDVVPGACDTDATVAWLDGAVWGQVDEGWQLVPGIDADGDGLSPDGGMDCDDADPLANVCAEETWYDGVDEHCDGGDDYDQDEDGHEAAEWGGGDCDDEEGRAHPGADEVPYDGIDEDCLGGTAYDQDEDGYAETSDCDDRNAAVHPGAEDTPGDAIDADCDGVDGDWSDAARHDATPSRACDGSEAGRSASPGWIALAILGLLRRSRTPRRTAD